MNIITASEYIRSRILVCSPIRIKQMRKGKTKCLNIFRNIVLLHTDHQIHVLLCNILINRISRRQRVINIILIKFNLTSSLQFKKLKISKPFVCESKQIFNLVSRSDWKLMIHLRKPCSSVAHQHSAPTLTKQPRTHPTQNPTPQKPLP